MYICTYHCCQRPYSLISMSSRCPSSKMPKRASIASALQCVGCVCERTHVPNPHTHSHMHASTSINTCINQVRPAHISLDVHTHTLLTCLCTQISYTHTHIHTCTHSFSPSLSPSLSLARSLSLSHTHTDSLDNARNSATDARYIHERLRRHTKSARQYLQTATRGCLSRHPRPTHNPPTLTSQCLYTKIDR